jgi:hypothetical protein
MSTNNTIQQWEYLVQPNYGEQPTAEWLNKFGAEGWQLISILHGISIYPYIVYFKRPIINTNEHK